MDSQPHAHLQNDQKGHPPALRTPGERLSYAAPRKDFGRMIFQKKNSPWVPYIFQIMSDGIGAAQRRQLRCQKWISILEQRCSYTPTTEAVLPSIHYARSVISRSGAALRRYRRTLFKKDMEPNGDSFLKKSSSQNPSLGPRRKSSPLGFATRPNRTAKYLDFV